MFEIPIWEKYALSIEEAADYFGIGQKKIRKIVDENPTAEFVLKNGVLVKLFGNTLFGNHALYRNSIGVI